MSLLSIISLTINAKKTYNWNKVINAIVQVESKGNANARSKDCVGILQIRPILVRDVNEYLKMKGSNKRFKMNDRLNAEKSKEMFIHYNCDLFGVICRNDHNFYPQSKDNGKSG